MSEPMMIKRRRSPRRLFDRTVGVLHRGNLIVIKAIEIGEGGLMIEAIPNVKVDDRIVVTFAIPGESLISTSGIVRYVIELGSGYAFGLQFNDFDIVYKRLVRRYVAAKTEQEATQEQTEKNKAKTYTFSVDEQGRPIPTAI